MEKKLSDLEPSDGGAAIEEVNVGFKLRRRLASMGIVPGREVTVVCKRRRGAIVVETENSIIAMDDEVASKILCEVRS